MMAVNIYGDFKKKIDRIQNHIAEEIAPQVNELLKESVRFSLVDWYNDYDPQDYNRTYNFMKILDSTRTRGKGNVLTLTVDSGSMNNYTGWAGVSFGKTYSIRSEKEKKANPERYTGQRLNASVAFDFMFMGGEHGRGKWLKHTSIPPYMYVDRDIASGFDGRLNKIVNDKIKEILMK